MALIRWSPRTWDPFRELSAFQGRMNRLFEETLPATHKEDEEFNLGTFYPAVDIHEGDKEITLKADLPGIKKEDVHLDIDDSVITLKGERKFEKEDKQDNYHRIERSYGSFHRSFTLPSTVDRDKIKAKYSNGILEITLPKTEEAKPKSIPVEVN